MPIPVRMRVVLSFITAMLLGLQWLQNRYLNFADGLSYLGIAEKYATGDWHGAVNAYWSPLWGWMLALLFRAGVARESTVAGMHAVQVLLAAVGLLLGMRLLARLHSNPSKSWLLTRWILALWPPLCLLGVWSVTPDLLAYVLFLCAVELAMNLWSGARWRTASLLGITMGLAYLSKSAMLPVCVCLLGCVAVRRVKQSSVAAVVLAAMLLPWVLAMHAKYGEWTLGSAGKLNYGFFVAGLTRIVHWQGELPEYGIPVHPTIRVWRAPDAFVFPDPIHAAYPPWQDPGYWYAGARPPFRFDAQWQAIVLNLPHALWMLVSAPGLVALLVLFRRRSQFVDWLRRVSRYWYLTVPSLVCIAMYSLVYVEPRYIAGPLFLLAAVPLAMAYAAVPRMADRIVPVAAIAGFLLAVAPPMLKRPAGNEYAAVAAEVKRRGISPGTSIAFAGLAINADWVRIGEYRIVGEVTAVHNQDESIRRAVTINVDNVNQFWNSPEDVKGQIFEKFRTAGARYIFANYVPDEADLTGWTLLESRLDSYQPDGRTYMRELPPLEHVDAIASTIR